jgi:hypothetical protein
MMPFKNFIDLFSGIYTDFDKIYPNQCMDLAHFYVFICLGIYDKSVLAADVAKNVWLKFNPAWGKYFKKIANVYWDTTQFPVNGDIIIWNGTDGHIAIVVDANGMNFHSFDANYPVGTRPHIQYHNYDNVLGWLRKI